MATDTYPIKSGPIPPQGKYLVHLILILLCGIISYATTFGVPFIFDDMASISENPVIQDLGNFLHGAGYAYNPRRFVAYLSFALNYRFGGLNVFGYHLVNLIIHIASGFLVYALASLALRAGRDRGPGTGDREKLLLVPDHWSLIPLFAALLFVVHPIQTQAVTYIVQRTASLAALFYLAAMVCYAKGREQGPGTGDREQRKAEDENSQKPFLVPGPRSRIIWFFLALVCGILAIKTKENAVTLPLAIILYEFVFYGFSRKKLFILLVPLCLGGVVAAIGIAGSSRPLGQLISDVSEMSRQTTVISRWEYLVTQFAVIATYLRLLVLPVNQNLDYDYPVYNSLAQARPLLGLLLHLSLIAVALWAWRRAYMGTRDQGPGTSAPASPFTIHYALIAFGILWFYLTLSVESSVIPITDVIFEHRLYLPVAGAFIAVAALFDMAAAKMGRRQVAAIAGVIVIAFMATTVARNSVWKSQISIWSDAVQKAPGKVRPLNNLGELLKRDGDVEQAIPLFKRVLAIAPTDYVALDNLGTAYRLQGRDGDAVECFRKALESKPGYISSRNNLAELAISRGDSAAAIPLLESLLLEKPDFDAARMNLGSAYLNSGRLDEALAAFREVLKMKPESADVHFNIGFVLERQGLLADAAREYGVAVQYSPMDADALLRWGNCAARLQQLDTASAAYERYLVLRPQAANIRNNLGVIYSMQGRRSEALAQFQEASRLKPDDVDIRNNLLHEQN